MGKYLDLTDKEAAVLAGSMILLGSIFFYSLYSLTIANTPKTVTLKVFMVDHWDQGSTIIYSYGQDKWKFTSYFDVEPEHSYEITYLRDWEKRWYVLLEIKEVPS